MFGFAMPMAFVVGLGAWTPAYFGRVHGWGIGQIGLWIGAGQMLMAAIGILAHGWLIDRWFGSGRRDAHMRYFAIMCALAAPLGAAAFLAADPWVSLALWNAAYFCMMAYVGIGAASLQIATPPDLRGKASAVYLIVVNVVGTIGGPLVVALITDYVFGDEQALGLSMAIFALLSGGAGVALFARGLGPMRRIIGEQLDGGTATARLDPAS
jgi:MFS family permease